ncbi:MAG TPA: methyltransferase domain-containing protein [Acidimicrobiia bacterium]|nr:methyltransferase domain-containing protein [Acidimicrobiia bacterium]
MADPSTAEPARGETYTHGHHESVLRSHRWRTVENSAAYLVPHLRPGTRVLDVGCGPGTITADLAARVAPGPVVGIDAAADIVEAARESAASVDADGAAISLRFDTGDVYALDFPDGSFDVVHAHQVLQHLADPVAALREMRRVCAPDGIVAARDADYAAMTWAPAVPELDEWMELFQLVTRANGGEPDAGRRLLGWARAAGFSRVAPSASVWCFATPEDRTWWGELWADRTVSSSFGTGALDLGLADRARLERIAAGWRRWVGTDDGWFAVLHGEILGTP